MKKKKEKILLKQKKIVKISNFFFYFFYFYFFSQFNLNRMEKIKVVCMYWRGKKKRKIHFNYFLLSFFLIRLFFLLKPPPSKYFSNKGLRKGQPLEEGLSASGYF
jgi:hypothetical protein